MERIRLTKRTAGRNRRADSAQPETPIDLGKNRKYHKIDEYHTFKPTLNHWEPDMRHEWKKDQTEREPTNHGIPRMAKVYMAAKKATKLAMMLLGEDAKEETIEKQARAFMRMGDKALTASIERWAECKGEDCKKPEVAAEDAEKPAPAEPAPEAPKAPEVKESAEEAEKPAPAEPAPEVKESCKAAGEKAEKEEKTEEKPAEPAPAEPAPAPAEQPAGDEEGEVPVDDELLPTDIDFDEPADGEQAADKDLEACFAADGEDNAAPAAEPAPAEAPAKKAGVKHLAGQPTLTRVASSKNADDLTGLWDKWSSPDIR